MTENWSSNRRHAEPPKQWGEHKNPGSWMILLLCGGQLRLGAFDIGEADRSVAAAVLGGVQRLVGPGDDVGLLASVVGVAGHADGQRRLEGPLLRGKALLFDLLANPLGQLKGTLPVGALEDDGELLAAIAGHDVDLARAGLENGRHA